MAKAKVIINGDSSDAQKAVGGLESKLQKAQQASMALAKGVGIAAAATGALGLKAIQLSGKIEQTEIALTTLTGSAADAKRIIQELQEFAATTPFQFSGLTSSVRLLITMGMEAQEATNAMKIVSDAVAAAGGGNEELLGVSRALGQIQAKGKLSAEELMQLAERGIPAQQILQEELNLTGEQVGDIGNQGVTAAEGIEALLNGLTKKFKGAAKEQAKTTLGIWSTFKDNITQALIPLGDILVDIFDIKENLSGTIESLQILKDTFEDMHQVIISDGLWEAMRNIIPEGTQRAIFGITGALVAGLIPAFYGLATSIWAAIAPLTPFLAAGAAVGLLAYEIMDNWEEAGTFLKTYWKLLSAQFSNMKNAMMITFEKLKLGIFNTLEKILGSLKAFENIPFIGKYFEDMETTIGNTADNSKNKIDELQQNIDDNNKKIADSTEKINGSFSKGWNNIKDTVSNIYDGITDIVGTEAEKQNQTIIDKLKKRGEAWNNYYEKLKQKREEQNTEEDGGGEVSTTLTDEQLAYQQNAQDEMMKAYRQGQIEASKLMKDEQEKRTQNFVSAWEKRQAVIDENIKQEEKKAKEIAEYQKNVQDEMMEAYRLGQIKTTQIVKAEKEKEKQKAREVAAYQQNVQDQMMESYRLGQIQSTQIMQDEITKRQEKEKEMLEAYRLGQIKASQIAQEEAEKRKQAIESSLGFLKTSMQDNFAAIMKGTKTVTEAFQSLWQSVIDAVIQQLAKMAAMKVFKWIVSGLTGGIGGAALSLLGFAEGGVVPGPKGQPQLAVVHGQEQVLTPEQRRSSGGVNIKITGNTISSDYDIDRIGDRLVKKLRRAGVVTT